MRVLRWLLTLLLLPAAATAQPRRCVGDNPRRTDALEREIRNLYNDATGHRSGVNTAQLAEVIARANALCDEAGSDHALYWLALARYALVNYAEASRQLDAYLAAHPVETLGRERRTVESLRADLRRHLARVQVVVRPPGVVVRVADTLVGEVEVPREPGPASVTLTSPDHEPLAPAPVLQLAAGTLTTLAITEDDRAPIPEGALRIVILRPPSPAVAVTRTVPATVGATTPDATSIVAPPPPLTVAAAPRPLRPWAIAATATAAASALLGVAFTIWWADQSAAYDPVACPVIGGAQCDAAYDQLTTANPLLTASFIAAGAFTVGAATLWALDRRDATRARRRAAVAECSVLPVGLRCTW